MTLNQIRNIVAVADMKSINAAAKSLFISQSTLSNSIKELEQELGRVLFQRNNRGITLTKDGEEFISYANGMLHLFQLMEAHFSSEEREKKNIGITMHHSTFLVRLFAEVIREFGMEKYRYSIFETNTQNILEDIHHEKSELGILYINDFNEAVYRKSFEEEGLSFTIISECQVFAYLHKDHPLAERGEVAIEELEEYPCLLFEQGKSSKYYYEEIFSDYEYKNVIKVKDRATAIDLINYLDAYSIGIGMASNSQMESTIKVIKIKSTKKIKLGYIMKSGAVLSPVSKKYIEKIKNYFL